MQFDRKQYIEWVARTSPDIEFSGVTVVTRDKTGQLSTLPILSTEGICHHDDPTNVLHFDSCCTGGRAAAFRAGSQNSIVLAGHSWVGTVRPVSIQRFRHWSMLLRALQMQVRIMAPSQRNFRSRQPALVCQPALVY